MKRLIGWFVVTLLIAAAAPALALAQSSQGRASLDMRATENGPSVCTVGSANDKRCSFPSGAKEIYLVVNYQDMPNVTLVTSLNDEAGGNAVFFKSDTFNGGGTKTYKVTGANVYNTYAAALRTNLSALSDAIRSARSASSSNRRWELFTSNVGQAANPAYYAARQMERFSVPGQVEAAGQIRTQLETVRAKINNAYTAGPNFAGLDQALADAETAANAATSRLSSITEVTTPLAFLDVNVASGNFPVASISRDNTTVESVSWAVSKEGLPTATAQPTAKPTDTPRPTETPYTPSPAQLTQVAGIAATSTATPVPQGSNPTATATAGSVSQDPTATSAPVGQPTAAPTATVQTGVTAAPPAPQPTVNLRQAQPVLTVTVNPSATPGAAQPTAAAKAAAGATAGAALPPAQPGGVQPLNAQVAGTATTAALALAPALTPTPAKVGGVVDMSRLTPEAGGISRVAGQTSGSSLPLATVGLAVVALGLGGAALWMRRRM